MPHVDSSDGLAIGRHSPTVIPATAVAASREPLSRPDHTLPGTRREAIASLYDEHFEFLWRALWRLGVHGAHVDDAIQDIFMVVLRRYADFENRSSIRTWLYGIALRVAAVHRRRTARTKPEPLYDEELASPDPNTPHDERERSEAAIAVQRIVNGMSDPLRTVFAMIELEQFSAPEVAELLNVPVNTVYSRLRLARAQFEREAIHYRIGEGRQR